MATLFHGITCADLYDRSVAAFRSRTAILFNDETYTYDALQKNAYSLAHALDKLGLKKGDRVAFLMANCPEYISEYALETQAGPVPTAVLLQLQGSHLHDEPVRVQGPDLPNEWPVGFKEMIPRSRRSKVHLRAQDPAP